MGGMKDGGLKDNKILRKAFIIAVLTFAPPVMIYCWIDRFKNPEFMHPSNWIRLKKLNCNKSWVPLWSINRHLIKDCDFKRTDTQSISITYHYHNRPKQAILKYWLENI